MKTKFSVILLFFLILNVSSENMVSNELSISEFKQKFLSEYELVSETEISGNVLHFDIAKKTNEIIMVVESDEIKYLNYYDSLGKKKWNHKLEFEEGIKSCEISDIGNLIVLQSIGFTQSYNNLGELIASTSALIPNLLPSPEGGYLYQKTGMMDPNQIKMKIYDRFLTPHIVELPKQKKNSLLRYKFVSENRIITLVNQAILILSFENYKIEVINEMKLPQETFLGEIGGEYQSRTIDYNDEYYALALADAGLHVFDMDGWQVYSTEKSYLDLAFVSNNTVIASTYKNKGNLVLIEVDMGKELLLDFNFRGSSKFGHIYGYLDIVNNLNGVIINNIITEPETYCLIFNKYQDNSDVDLMHNCIVEVNDDYVRLINLEEKPSITIFERK